MATSTGSVKKAVGRRKAPAAEGAAPAAPRARRKAAVRPAVPPGAAAPTPAPAPITPEKRFKMIEEAAYYLAQKDGFRGHPNHYWTVAERQIAEQLAKR